MQFDDDFEYVGLQRYGGDESNTLKAFNNINKSFYLATEFKDSTDIAQQRRYAFDETDILVYKTDSSGNVVKSIHFAGLGAEILSSMVLDSDSAVYLSGEFENQIYFDGDSLVSNGSKDIFLIKSDPDLNILWALSFGSQTNEYAKSLSVNNLNTVYVSGSFIDTLTLGNKTIVSEARTADMYIAKFSADGQNEGLKQAGGSGFEYSNVLLNDPDNYLYIIGDFDYDFAFETDSLSSDSLFNAYNEDVFMARFYDCDYARFPDIGRDTSFCGSGTLSVLNPEGLTNIFGKFKNYLWNTGQKTQSITVYDSGFYYVSTIDNHKCPVNSDTVFVAVYPLPEPELGADITMTYGDSILLFGGNFEAYQWNTTDTIESITVLYDSLENFANEFTLEVTNAYDCYKDDNIFIYKEGASYSGGGYLENPVGPMRMIDGGEVENSTIPGILNNANPKNKVLIPLQSEVYPNPNNGHFYVNTSNIDETLLEMRIYTEEGKQIEVENNILSSPYEVNIDSNGVHYLILETKNKIFFEKIIIK